MRRYVQCQAAGRGGSAAQRRQRQRKPAFKNECGKLAGVIARRMICVMASNDYGGAAVLVTND